MMGRIAGLCLVVLLPGTAMAQAKTRTVDQLAAEVNTLRQSLSSANETLSKLAAQVQTNTQAVTKNSDGLTRLAEQMNQELSKQQEILERIDELAIQQQEQLARQQAILDAITQPDSQGQHVLQLSANMEQSDEFRQDLRKAVHQVLQTHGDLIIRNQMPGAQRILVNQREYRLGPGELLTLNVPVGTVSVQLPGQSLTNWTVGPPDYRQKIDIVPDANAQVAYRPVSTEPLAPLPSTPVEMYYRQPMPSYVVPAPIPWVTWPY